MVSDIDATIKEERLFPYLFGLTISTIGIVLNWFLGYDTLAVIWVIYFATMLLLLVINKFWKISAHALGVSIPFGVLIFYEGLSSIYYIPMILLICWSRIHLKKHSVMQVVFGAVLGLFFSYTIIKLL